MFYLSMAECKKENVSSSYHWNPCDFPIRQITSIEGQKYKKRDEIIRDQDEWKEEKEEKKRKTDTARRKKKNYKEPSQIQQTAAI